MNIIIGSNSVILRNMLKDILSDAGETVVGLTSNGNEIIDMVNKEHIDLIILGTNLSGLSEENIIDEINENYSIPVVFMLDPDTKKDLNAQLTISKPEMDIIGEDSFQKELLDKLRKTAAKYRSSSKKAVKNKINKIDHIVIGSSTGGPKALKKILDNLPEDFPIPISIVQHLESGHEEGLANWLNKSCKLDVRLAIDGDTPQKGEIIMGVQGKHLSVKDKKFYLTDEDKVQFQKPAVDILFTTASYSFKENLLGILLTGMGRDGAKGCLDIIKNNGVTVVQNEKSSTVYGMPKAAVDLNAASIVLPLDEISKYIIETVEAGSK